jgi:hypothetical protein
MRNSKENVTARNKKLVDEIMDDLNVIVNPLYYDITLVPKIDAASTDALYILSSRVHSLVEDHKREAEGLRSKTGLTRIEYERMDSLGHNLSILDKAETDIVNRYEKIMYDMWLVGGDPSSVTLDLPAGSQSGNTGGGRLQDAIENFQQIQPTAERSTNPMTPHTGGIMILAGAVIAYCFRRLMGRESEKSILPEKRR